MFEFIFEPCILSFNITDEVLNDEKKILKYKQRKIEEIYLYLQSRR